MTKELPLIELHDSFEPGSHVHNWIVQNQACPACPDHGRLLAGPSGGFGQNFKCASCETVYNHMGPFGIKVVGLGAPLLAARTEVEAAR